MKIQLRQIKFKRMAIILTINVFFIILRYCGGINVTLYKGYII